MLDALYSKKQPNPKIFAEAAKIFGADIYNTKEFVETSVDDISLNLLKRLYDLAIKTEKPSFTKDLAMLVDVMRGLIYRDFNIKHPSQVMSEKMVELKTMRDGTQSARINYDIFKRGKTVPLNPEVKEELKDGPGNFEPEGDL